jgi:hypothetical protein
MRLPRLDGLSVCRQPGPESVLLPSPASVDRVRKVRRWSVMDVLRRRRSVVSQTGDRLRTILTGAGRTASAGGQQDRRNFRVSSGGDHVLLASVPSTEVCRTAVCKSCLQIGRQRIAVALPRKGSAPMSRRQYFGGVGTNPPGDSHAPPRVKTFRRQMLKTQGTNMPNRLRCPLGHEWSVLAEDDAPVKADLSGGARSIR